MKENIQKHKVPLIVGTLIIVALLIYVYQNKLASFFLYPGANAPGSITTGAAVNTNVSNSSNNSSSSLTNDTVLKKGDQGDKVAELQVLMNKKMEDKNFGFAALTVDKNFGPKTEGALYNLISKKSISINQFKTYT